MSGSGVGWGPSRTLRAAEIAERFFVRQQSKVEIARDLDMSRFQVARALEGATDRGLVRIDITAGDVDHRASAELRDAYGLRRAFVTARSPRSPSDGTVAAVAAGLLAETIGPDDVLGLAWSRTVNDVVDTLGELAACSVVQLCGTYALPWRRDTSPETVSRAGAVGGGPTFPIYAPLVLPNAVTTDALRAQPGVAEAVAMFARLSTAVVSIGAWRPGHSTVFDLLTPEEQRDLGDRGVVAEMVGLLLDEQGGVVESDLAGRVLAIDVDRLRAVPETVALVRDPTRARAARAAVMSGLIGTLVTDSETAAALLEQP